MHDPIFLDYNATSPIRPAVLEAMTAALAEGGNPSSVHRRGRRAHAALEKARAQVAGLMGCQARQIVFTSGGTEANNAILSWDKAGALVVGATEHDSVLAPARLRAARDDLPLALVPTDHNGIIDPDDLAALLKQQPKPALVSIMASNNETGVIQQLGPLVEIAHAHGAIFHCDASQAASKIPLNFAEMGVDAMTVSGHKLGAATGVGALILRDGLPFQAAISGGGQELGRRSGTENLAGIIGFGIAAAEALAQLQQFASLSQLRHRLEKQIKAMTSTAVIVAEAAPRLANTSCIILPGIPGETQVMHFDLDGIAVSSGAACSSGKVSQSHVLAAMGYAMPARGCAVRISMGRLTQESDIDRLVDSYARLIDRKRGDLTDAAQAGA